MFFFVPVNQAKVIKYHQYLYTSTAIILNKVKHRTMTTISSILPFLN
jgi:hypothetical protein